MKCDEQDLLHRRALKLAAPNRATAGTAPGLTLFQFALHSEIYGMEVRYVEEVFALQHFTPVPSTPDFVMGVTSHHGEIVSLIDLGRFFAQPRMALTNLNKVVIVHSGDLKFGIVIDAALAIRRVDVDELRAPPESTELERDAYVMGITPDKVIVLAMASIFANDRIVVRSA